MKKFITYIILALAISYGAYSTVPDPCAYWKLDKCSGTTAPDEITPYAPGTLNISGGYPQWVAGHSNQCLRFFGSNNYVSIGTPAKLNFINTSNFTIAVWVKPFGWNPGGADNGDQQIFSKGYNGTSTQYELKKITLSGQDYMTLRTFNNGVYGYVSAPISKVPINTWTHIIAEYKCTDEANGLGTYTLYFNGGTTVGTSKFVNTNQHGPVTNAMPVLIGAVAVNGGSLQDWWNGLIDEVKVFSSALSDDEAIALYASEASTHGWACDVTPPQTNLALWLNPYHITDGTPVPTDDTPVSTWKDLTGSGSTEEDATMSTSSRQPKFESAGINGPGVVFTYDYGDLNYGNSDILISPQQDEIVSTSSDMYSPSSASKDLFVVFKTGNSIDGSGSEHPYYSDGRQCIFEAGGPLSGFNVYIKNGKIIFGMWNRFERKFEIMDEDETNFYPMSTDKIYLAHLEYDGTTNKFRAIVGNEVTTEYSDAEPFRGLTRDAGFMDDYTGIGGASRTCYDDYSTGETYSDHFGGAIGDVLLYNTFLSSANAAVVYKYINDRYGTNFTYPTSGIPMPHGGNGGKWITIEKLLTPDDALLVSSAYPNPFATTTSFGINLPEKQYVNVEVFDAMGNRVQNIYAGELSSGVHDFKIDGANLTSGMYLYKVTGTGFVKTGKVILSK